MTERDPGPLPAACFATHPVTGEAVALVRGKPGYQTLDLPFTAQEMNRALGSPPTPVQVQAMMEGALFGWPPPASADTDPTRRGEDPWYSGYVTGLRRGMNGQYEPPGKKPVNQGDGTDCLDLPAIESWGSYDEPLVFRGFHPVNLSESDDHTIRIYSKGHLGLFGWLKAANSYASRTFGAGIMTLNEHDWESDYNVGSRPTDAVNVAFDMYWTDARPGRGDGS